MKRYEQLADEMRAAIDAGTLRPGERLPSVREARAARQLSPSTVFAAYGLLETQGLIEARPRSGYYVRARARPAHPEPRAATPTAGTLAVQVSELVFEV
ncbi:MAG TPA: winged helix-turn-helix domain-containing protein, partial [Methylibium sp.]|nr:winged helix-turn-helix domain-containing protein [Methylibium sp.]